MTPTGLRRFAPLGLAAAVLCAAAVPAAGQGTDLKPFRKELKTPLGGLDLNRMLELKTAKLRTAGPDLKQNQDLFDRVSKSFVYKATEAQYYIANETGELKPKATDQNFENVLKDLESYILVPTGDGKTPLDAADYAKEFGVAFDRTVREVLLIPNLPPVMKVNVGRLLALSARSGAPAHAKTVTDLLTNQFYKGKDGKTADTPPELLYWALKAAESLLAAHDPYAPPIGPTAGRHTIPEADLVKLVAALEGLILKNPQVYEKAANLTPDAGPTPPPLEDPKAKDKKDPPKDPKDPAAEPPPPLDKSDPKGWSKEQLDLVRFFRRQAVRALAKVRFDKLGGEAGIPEVRPGYTLARVAIADVAINPAPSTTEVAEAVIGLCGINPSPPLHVDELGIVIAYGVTVFVRGKAQEEADGKPTVPWRAYAGRLGAAMAGLKRNTQLNARLKGFQKPLSDLADIVQANVVAPLEKGEEAVQPNLDPLERWIQDNPPKDKARSFYNAAPQYKFTPRSAGG